MTLISPHLLANYGLNCIGTYNGCTFKSNKAVSGGGALSNGFKADVTFKDCTFLSNSANYGGAIFTQNDTTGITLDGCMFQDNEAAGTSGTELGTPMSCQLPLSVSEKASPGVQ